MAYFAIYGPNCDLDTRERYLFLSMVHTVGHFLILQAWNWWELVS